MTSTRVCHLPAALSSKTSVTSSGQEPTKPLKSESTTEEAGAAKAVEVLKGGLLSQRESESFIAIVMRSVLARRDRRADAVADPPPLNMTHLPTETQRWPVASLQKLGYPPGDMLPVVFRI